MSLPGESECQCLDQVEVLTLQEDGALGRGMFWVVVVMWRTVGVPLTDEAPS